MTEELQIYKCERCGNIVEVIRSGTGTLVCCGIPMKLLTGKETTTPTAHLTSVEFSNRGTIITIGEESVRKNEHILEWIKLIAGNRAYRKFLKSSLPIRTSFGINEKSYKIRAFCSKEGLWEIEKKVEQEAV